MPYIRPEDRARLADFRTVPRTAGELNYCITLLLQAYLANMMKGTKPGYKEYNEVIGVLECAKLELYRRLVAPYEDTKIKENGDVY